ncbi:MAG TPA: hypothetical protein QF353_01685 [Gammaproteobacteria bacterium]|nr:hypothetical protein [Gammaproteobacteria bacterium]
MLDYKYSHIPVFSLINKLEKNIYFQNWCTLGVNLWPVLRVSIRVYIKNISSCKDKPPKESIHKKSILKIVTILGKVFQIVVGVFFILPKIFLNGQVKYIYMTDGVSLDCIDEKWGDKYFRGLQINHSINPKDCLFLSPIKLNKNFKHLAYNILELEWLENLAEIIASIYIRITKHLFIPKDYAQFINIIKENHLNMEDFSVRSLNYKACKVAFLARFFKFLLKTSKIERVIIVSFYHDMGFALNIAAHRADIVSCDIQHGTMISHDAYCEWTTVPKHGYKEFPKCYLTWDKPSSKCIKSWSKKTNYHEVLETGNLSHKIWLHNSDLTLKYDTLINNLKKKMKHDNCFFDILVTLQPIAGFRKNWDTLADVIMRKKLNVRWWLRHHPTTISGGRSEGIEKISKISLTNVEYINASNLPLCALLRNINLHVTVRSSTYIECEAFGIKTLFISEYGILEHKKCVDDKTLLYATTEEDIMSTILTLTRVH